MFGTKLTFSRKKNLQSMLKHTEFEINPFESDFFIVQPLSPLGFPEPLTPPPPLGISNSLRGGGMDIFRSHTISVFEVGVSKWPNF